MNISDNRAGEIGRVNVDSYHLHLDDRKSRQEKKSKLVLPKDVSYWTTVNYSHCYLRKYHNHIYGLVCEECEKNIKKV